MQATISEIVSSFNMLVTDILNTKLQLTHTSDTQLYTAVFTFSLSDII